MIRDINRLKGMSNKEIMYIVASDYDDHICMQAVRDAEDMMENITIRDMIQQAAIVKLCYEDRRKISAIQEIGDDYVLSRLERDYEAYMLVLGDVLFQRKYGDGYVEKIVTDYISDTSDNLQ